MEFRDQDGTLLMSVGGTPDRETAPASDIVRMAQQAGFPVTRHLSGRYDIAGQSVARFGRFAALVRAQERGACIDDCNAEARDDGTAQRIIERIRARSQA
jgi:hypothetical protein